MSKICSFLNVNMQFSFKWRSRGLIFRMHELKFLEIDSICTAHTTRNEEKRLNTNEQHIKFHERENLHSNDDNEVTKVMKEYISIFFRSTLHDLIEPYGAERARPPILLSPCSTLIVLCRSTAIQRNVGIKRLDIHAGLISMLNANAEQQCLLFINKTQINIL